MSKLQIPSETARQIQAAGFTRKGLWFFRTEGSLVQCVCFEHPGKTIYPVYCIIPLYMPFAARHFTYGRRISEISHYQNGEEIDVVCLREVLNSQIFPFFDTTRTPISLLHRVQIEQRIPHFFFCSPVRLSQLKMYTSLYLMDRELFREAADETTQVLCKTQGFTDSVKCHISAEIAMLRDKSRADDASLLGFFDEIIAKSRNCCSFY